MYYTVQVFYMYEIISVTMYQSRSTYFSLFFISDLCQKKGIENCFDWSADVTKAQNGLVYKMLVIMVLQGFIYFLLCLLTDSNTHSSMNMVSLFQNFLFKRRATTRVQDFLTQDESKDDVIYFTDYKHFLDHTVVVKDLWSQYSANSQEVTNLNFTVKPHQCFVVLGPASCGKSMLLRMIVGKSLVLFFLSKSIV